MELKEEAEKFLLYAYFGIVDNDDEDTIAKKCAHRAYLDLNRSILFNDRLKESNGRQSEEKKYIKKLFQEEISQIIVDEIKKINNSDNFDSKHHDICRNIITTSGKLHWKENRILKEELTYGQAQKWLNMTLKYMWLLQILDINLTSKLHVPVDRYIMEAASGRTRKTEETSTKGLGVHLPGKNGEEINSYSESKVLSWSKWKGVEKFNDTDKSDYHCFQEELRNELNKLNKTPIEWEGCSWIEVAEKVKKAETKTLDITISQIEN